MSTRGRSTVLVMSDVRGNHHLMALVVGLTAVLGALAIYAVVIRNQPVPDPTASSNNSSQVVTAEQVPETPKSRTSFVGEIRDIRTDRISVATAETQGGVTRERMILVLLPNTTVYFEYGPADISANADPLDERPKTEVSRSAMQLRQGVEVHVAESFDGQSTVSASQIDILTPAS